jgi:3-dehydroquinate synthase
VLDFLQQNNATKQTVVIAIGGGVIQDIATFSAHLYYRGIRWIYIPTTLLGMCDSCIGAKCGINLNSFKNQLGVFHSPHRVLICLPFLETLSDAEIVSGYGEILKLLLTGSAEQFALLVKSVEKEGLRNSQLSRLIYESLLVKKGVIEKDEYEQDLRRILNYGHTFGHALEAITHHGIPHGKAIAWGIDLVNFMAKERGLLSPGEYDSIHIFIRKHFTHRLPQAVSARELIDASRRDKKVADGKVNLILLRTIGELQIVPTVFDARLEEEVGRHLDQKDVLSWP